MARKRIGEILVQAGVLDSTALRAALVEQRRWGGQLGRILVDMNLVTEEALVEALSQQLNFPTVDLDNIEMPDEVIDLIPGELAAQHHMIPYKREGKFLDVAMSEPTNLGIIDELRIRTQLNVRPYLAGPTMIERAIERCYGAGLFDELGDNALNGVMPPAQTAGSTMSPNSVTRTSTRPGTVTGPVEQAAVRGRDEEIRALQARVSQLEALVTRDEDVLKKVLGLLVEKGIATREEILERIR